MVKEWGMSEIVGFRTIESSNNSLVVVNDLSPETSELIDSEIKRLLQVMSFRNGTNIVNQLLSFINFCIL